MINHTWRRLLAAGTLLAAALILNKTFRLAVVRGDSMSPTFHDGEAVLVSETASRTQLKQGDVVLVRCGGEVLIKRVAYLSGDVIPLPDAAAFARCRDYFEPVSSDAATAEQDGEPLRVPRGSIVVLGDNRTISDDSRSFGPVPLTDVLGKVMNAPEHS